MELWDLLQAVYAARDSGDLKLKDSASSELLAFLQDSPATTRFPVRFASQAISVLQKYCAEILPQLPMSSDDRRWMEGEHQQAIEQLRQQQAEARELEVRCAEFFNDIRTSRRNMSLLTPIDKRGNRPFI